MSFPNFLQQDISINTLDQSWLVILNSYPREGNKIRGTLRSNLKA